MKVYLRGLLMVGTVFMLFVALGDDVVGRPPETGRWAWAKWCLESEIPNDKISRKGEVLL